MPTARGALRDEAFTQMGGLRSIAGVLVGLPAKASAAAGDPAHSAVAFKLPYTLNLTDDEHSNT